MKQMKELFSRRYLDQKGDPEVYIYKKFTAAFRNQCFHIINSFLMRIKNNYQFVNMTEEICESYSREKGLKHLSGNYGYTNDLSAVENYIDKSSNEDFIDFLDFVFTNYLCDQTIQKESTRFFHFASDPFQDAIDELNLRFKQNGLGYECTNGEIIQKTNEVTHQTIVKPALKLLADERFRGAEEEYLEAFDRFKKGNNKDAIMNAEKAFESTIKIICQYLGYECKDEDTAKKLVETLKSNGFFPPYLESYLNNMCNLLKEGAPVVRNKESGHGQGGEIKETSDEYVEYVLNTVASNIVFLYGIFESRSKK